METPERFKMKKCPYCGAEIEKNARFCLYCMRELEEKTVIEITPSFITKYKSRIISICVTVLVVALVTVSAVLIVPRLVPSKQATPPSDRDTDTEQAQTSPADGSDTEDFDTDFEDGGEEAGTDDTSFGGIGTPDHGEIGSQVTYTYRDAQFYDLLSGADKTDTSLLTENAIVITGVETGAKDGIYIIPEQIDGKKVVAVLDGTFSDNSISSNVKTVVVPSCVHSFKEKFRYNDKLTDLYFSGEFVVLDLYTFPLIPNRALLTVHASADAVCYYGSTEMCTIKERAQEFGIAFQEWDKESGIAAGTNVLPSDGDSLQDPEKDDSQVTYTYRVVESSDLINNQNNPFSSQYQIMLAQRNALVITGIETPAENGVYIIPEQIDGMAVVAVSAGVFSDYLNAPYVKTIVIPSSICSFGDSLEYCEDLTDVYFCGEAIVLEQHTLSLMMNRKNVTVHAIPGALCYYGYDSSKTIEERATQFSLAFEGWDGKFESGK